MHSYSAFGLNLLSEVELPELISKFSNRSDNFDICIKQGKAKKDLGEQAHKGVIFQAGDNEFILELPNVARYYLKNINSRKDNKLEIIFKAIKESEILSENGIIIMHRHKKEQEISIPSFEVIEKKINSGEIEIAPLAFMRGRTLKNSFAILDEAQNATETQIKMFLTRIGENTKLVVNGDPSQIDLINKNYSGLTKSKKILSKLKEIKMITFDHTDVIRHPIVSKIIQAYQNENND